MENIVYTSKYCPYCVRVKQLLKSKAVDFEERLLDSDEELLEIKKKYNWSSVPIVILNGQLVGGYDQTKELADAGKLV